MNNLAEKITGAWNLVSFQMVNNNGYICHPLGESAKGFLCYLPDGYVSVHIMQRDRQEVIDCNRFAGADFKYNELGYLAYCGRYHIDANKQVITHEVDISLYPEWIGGQQIRLITLRENQLELSSTGAVGPENIQFSLRWQRAG